MSIITSSSISRGLEPGVNAWLLDGYKSKEPQYTDVFTVYKSNKKVEYDVVVSSPGLLAVRSESAAVTYDDFQQYYEKRYTHVEYSSGFVISQIAIEDNQYKEIAEMRAHCLGRSAVQTVENVCANVLNNIASTTGGDGVYYASTAHTLGKGGTCANMLTNGSDLSEVALEDMIIGIMNFRNEANLIIQATPRKLIVPRQEIFNAQRILKSTLQNDTANNAINALGSMNMLPEGVRVNNYLTDDDAYFVLTDATEHGFKLFHRRGDLNGMELKNDTDFDTDNVKFKMSMRFCAGITDWRAFYYSAGS